jgi:hypothetical protein
MKEKIMKLLKWITTEDASLTFIGVGFLILVLTACVFLCNFGHCTTRIDSEKLDHFGSFISGLVGSLWSLASFILLYVSLQQQKADVKLTNEALTLQIEEFKQQKIELEGTKIALEEQGKTQQLQQFETTFFNLLNYYDSIINTLHCDDDKGKRAFNALYNRIEEHSLTLKCYQDEKDAGYIYYYFHFISYFGYIENTLCFFCNDGIQLRKSYVNLFLSILTKQEKYLILAHCLISTDLKEIVQKISIINDTFKQFPLYNEIFETPTTSEITSYSPDNKSPSNSQKSV